MPADPKNVKRAYGNYFGTTFYVAGSKTRRWRSYGRKENGYWKIVSWRVGADRRYGPRRRRSRNRR